MKKRKPYSSGGRPKQGVLLARWKAAEAKKVRKLLGSPKIKSQSWRTGP